MWPVYLALGLWQAYNFRPSWPSFFSAVINMCTIWCSTTCSLFVLCQKIEKMLLHFDARWDLSRMWARLQVRATTRLHDIPDLILPEGTSEHSASTPSYPKNQHNHWLKPPSPPGTLSSRYVCMLKFCNSERFFVWENYSLLNHIKYLATKVGWHRGRVSKGFAGALLRWYLQLYQYLRRI